MANTIVNNKKARFDYIIIDDYEAGIALKGWEVKSLRAGRGNIKESYATIKGSELLLIGAHISPLFNSNVTDESAASASVAVSVTTAVAPSATLAVVDDVKTGASSLTSVTVIAVV